METKFLDWKQGILMEIRTKQNVNIQESGTDFDMWYGFWSEIRRSGPWSRFCSKVLFEKLKIRTGP